MMAALLTSLTLLALVPHASAQVSMPFGQCGGIGWTGPTICPSGFNCIFANQFFSQCLPLASTTSSGTNSGSIPTTISSSTSHTTSSPSPTTTISPPVSSPNLTVALEYATYLGIASGGVDKFLGMRFATATRFGTPGPPTTTGGLQTVSAYGPACPQASLVIPTVSKCPTTVSATTVETAQQTPSLPAPPTVASEDCHFINVIRPSGIGRADALPVVFWIYGGGFQIGDTSFNDGSSVVNQSIKMGEPTIYVSANYRLTAFGFLGSEEIKAAGVGNLGLRDQRFAMQWIQKYIPLFGGDPTKVTLWGESAGAWSAGIHMFVNNGNQGGLFRGVFLESGSPIVVNDISTGQPIFDQLATLAGCSSSSDKLACLTVLPFNTLQSAINQMPNVFQFSSLNLAWKPYVDGTFVTQSPLTAISNGGLYSKVPVIAGNCEDEGTLFSLSQLNLTTDQTAAGYIHTNYVPGAPDANFQPLANFYTSNTSEGSPYGSGGNFSITPEYKRLASIQGDLFFQAPRRSFLSVVAKTQKIWAYLYRRNKAASPCLGSFHGSALTEWYGAPGSTLQGTTALINFINNGDPNMGKILPITWPVYVNPANSSGPEMLSFENTSDLGLIFDTYRAEGMEILDSLFPFYV